jgi:hypothetical protein
LAISCKKKSETTTPPVNTVSGFTCNIGGTAFSADSAVWHTNGTQTFILAYKGGRAEFEINLSGVTATTYGVLAGVNDFIYWPTPTAFAGGIGGSLIISNYDNGAGQLTGSFGPITASGPGGAFYITEGAFTKIPKR